MRFSSACVVAAFTGQERPLAGGWTEPGRVPVRHDGTRAVRLHVEPGERDRHKCPARATRGVPKRRLVMQRALRQRPSSMLRRRGRWHDISAAVRRAHCDVAIPQPDGRGVRAQNLARRLQRIAVILCHCCRCSEAIRSRICAYPIESLPLEDPDTGDTGSAPPEPARKPARAPGRRTRTPRRWRGGRCPEAASYGRCRA